MTRKTAMRIRMDLAMEMDPADFNAVMASAKAIETLKAAATELGFTFTSDVSAKLGSVGTGKSGQEPAA